AVRGPQVLHAPRGAVAEEDLGMAARHRVAVDLDVTVGAAAEDELLPVEREALAHVRPRRIDEHETRGVRRALRLVHLDLGDPRLPLAAHRLAIPGKTLSFFILDLAILSMYERVRGRPFTRSAGRRALRLPRSERERSRRPPPPRLHRDAL